MNLVLVVLLKLVKRRLGSRRGVAGQKVTTGSDGTTDLLAEVLERVGVDDVTDSMSTPDEIDTDSAH